MSKKINLITQGESTDFISLDLLHGCLDSDLAGTLDKIERMEFILKEAYQAGQKISQENSTVSYLNNMEIANRLSGYIELLYDYFLQLKGMQLQIQKDYADYIPAEDTAAKLGGDIIEAEIK